MYESHFHKVELSGKCMTILFKEMTIICEIVYAVVVSFIMFKLVEVYFLI